MWEGIKWEGGAVDGFYLCFGDIVILKIIMGKNNKGLRNRRKEIEWIAEGMIRAVALTAVLMVALIFIFIGWESLGIVFQKTDNSKTADIIQPDQVGDVSRERLAEYLDMSVEELEEYDGETLAMLLEVRSEELTEVNNPDSSLNTVSYRMIFFPYKWSGYEKSGYVWQPNSEIEKFNIIPLVAGSLKATVVALIFSLPLSLLAAIYVSEFAPRSIREVIKPVIELLAGIPSVVLGFFALIVMASWMQFIFGYESRLNTLISGIAIGIAVIPITFTITEDAFRSVPYSYREAALALGSTQWQVAYKVVLPYALPGFFGASVLGFGRAIGETMIVLMASGNAAIISFSPFDSVRTMTATIAAELAEVAFGSSHYKMLFFIGAILFAVTLISNFLGDVVIHNLKMRIEGKI